MLIRELFETALLSVSKNRLRSLLTSLGVIIGVSAVIILSAMGNGTQVLIEREINSLGTNLLIVFPGDSRSAGVHRGAGSFNRFTYDDVEAIKKKSKLVTDVSPIVQSGGQIIAEGNNWGSEICGVSPEYFAIKNWELKYGTYFTDKDVKASRKVAILGATISDELFADRDPTGKTIRIRNIPFHVIGVLKDKGEAGMGRDQDDVVIAPWTTVLYRLKGGRFIDMINASAVSTDRLEDAEEEITSIIRDAHDLGNGEEDDFTIHNQTEIIETVSKTSKIMTWYLGSIAAISLIVGGIGIMNIMLVSVTERTREIGIRMALGARERDILFQFLSEATLLSLGGGLIGIVLSFVATFSINEFTNLYAVITVEMILIAFIFSGVVGMFFGYYPAQKAARLTPIESLRYE